jgi:hypothetical protein
MPEFEGYREASNYQLEEWVAGRPWHNPWAPNGSFGKNKEDGECCPDFSCCGGPLAPKEERLAFAATAEHARDEVRRSFFRRWVADVNKRIESLEKSRGGNR